MPDTQDHTPARNLIDEHPLSRADRRSKIALALSSVSLLAICLTAANSFFGPIRIVVGEPEFAQHTTKTAIVTEAPNPMNNPAKATSDGIRVLTYENQPYAYDSSSGQFFVFDSQMNPSEAPQSEIPPQAVEQLITNAVQAPVVGNTDAAFAEAMATNNAIAEGDDLKINVLLADKDVASQTLAAFDKAAGIDLGGQSATPGKRVYVFFDPRCPYCHKLYADIAGKTSSKWLPTLALGADGAPLVNYILGNGTVEISTGADGKTSASMKPDAARPARLQEVVGDGAQPASTAAMTPETDFITRENETLMRVLYGAQEHLIGVPTVVVELPDGTAKVLRGYDEDTVKQILDLQGKE